MQLTSVGHQQPLAELHQSPFTLKPELLRRIHEERKEAATGRPARIQARMNALSDPEVIHALYEASQAGVSIDLVVRGVCCLRPGLPGVSENIRVRSIVGRFLEHTRAWRFGLGERECCFLTSADWMPRNLHRRVEVVFPVLDPELAGRVVDESLLAYLGDDAQAWLLDSSGAWTRPPVASTPTSAQELLLARESDPQFAQEIAERR